MSNAFPWILTLAVVAGLAWLLLPAPAQPRVFPSRGPSGRPESAFEAGLVSLAAGLLGARLGFVLTHLAYFSQDSWEIARLWRGGLSGPSAVLGAACGLSLFAIATRQPFWPLADALAARPYLSPRRPGSDAWSTPAPSAFHPPARFACPFRRA